MPRRNQPSSVDRLPADLVDALNALRTRQGWTIKELREWLATQGHAISPSAMGRHVRSLHLDVEQAGDKINRAQVISKALIERFGDRPDNELARLNIQMLHGQVFDMILAEDAAVDEDGNAVPGDSLKIVRMTKAVQQLLSAEKMNAERVVQIKKEAVVEERERAKAALDVVAKRPELGMSKEMVEAFKREILKVG